MNKNYSNKFQTVAIFQQTEIKMNGSHCLLAEKHTMVLERPCAFCYLFTRPKSGYRIGHLASLGNVCCECVCVYIHMYVCAIVGMDAWQNVFLNI